MVFRIEVHGERDVLTLLSRVSKKLPVEMDIMTRDIALTASRKAKTFAAEHKVTGQLQAGITASKKRKNEYLVTVKGPAREYAGFAEVGTRPHKTPLNTRTILAAQKYGRPKKFARNIASKGTRGIFIFEKAFVETIRNLDRITEDRMARVIR